MKRHAEKRLDEWFKNVRRKPLVIRGARQVGNSTLVRQFAKANGLTLHEVNMERHLKLRDVFAGHDTRRILNELEYICQKGRYTFSGRDPVCSDSDSNFAIFL